MPAGRLLFVCAQNVCRSPFLALSTVAGLERRGLDMPVVTSRGTVAAGGMPICEVAAARLPSAVDDRAAEHRSRQLTASDLQRADIVLTASSTERSAAALLLPGVRPRLFTVREAALLGEGMDAADLAAASDGESALRRLAATLHARRGRVELPLPETRRIGRRRVIVNPIDIPDAHVADAASHRRLFAELSADVERLIAASSPVMAM